MTVYIYYIYVYNVADLVIWLRYRYWLVKQAVSVVSINPVVLF